MNNKRKVREFLSYTEKYLSYVLFICIGSCFVALILSESIDSDFYSLFIESFLSSKEIGLYILAFIILLQVVFIFWAVYKGFIENEL
ncbi:hypothetical protein LZX05_08230 [Campylobacter coli]|uniref:hypothetical protein n=1 Tax=Campylobacter coli TaxID=195 RepID=UPI00126CFFA2|nr:hypothetical protein [Campylobacter coli]EAJ7673257.1 hypothetical protein [Campylobacter coli]EDO6878446.1 hypothetical protein [Campylobacter coli]MCE7239223.1 hypothetical protein [Campylobacter coli]MCE7300049.1 hypothetical protein [Campylobacter coli]MCH3723811.1 hypothetical protein [Campylobacter coli]